MEVRFRPVSYELLSWERKLRMPQVPCIGEGVTLDGHPFVVTSVSWDVETASVASEALCYVTLIPRGSPPPWEAGIAENC